MTAPEEESYFDAIVYALQEMPRESRISAIAAACDDDDMRELVQLAAYSLRFAVLDEIKKVFEQAFADYVKEPQP
jgi:hypothetical protein